MEAFEFIDALTGDKVIQDYATGEVVVESAQSEPAGLGTPENPRPRSVFFPGCSMINYAMPLVASVYDTLREYGQVDAISVLCCGKILSYEPNGDVIRATFEGQLRDRIAQRGIQRLVCACPNCVKALRNLLGQDERTASVEVAVLPQVLAEIGFRLDPATVALLVKGDATQSVKLCTHDSCPDRETGEFADGLRAIMPEGLWVDPKHCRRTSVCCGSLPRAAGNAAAADKCADTCGREALEVGADAIVTACLSCTFQLNMAQPHVQCVHFLELLYNWRIDWSSVGAWMKVRFLFDETLGVTRRAKSGRTFAGLGGAGSTEASAGTEASEEVTVANADAAVTADAAATAAASDADTATVADLAAAELEHQTCASEDLARDLASSKGVSISNNDVEQIGL